MLDFQNVNEMYDVAKTKVLISFTFTANLFCAYVFAYAKCWFSHDVAQIFKQFNSSATTL